MKYLLDTNIYIAAYDRYYRKEYFPTYWERFAEIINDYVVAGSPKQSGTSHL